MPTRELDAECRLQIRLAPGNRAYTREEVNGCCGLEHVAGGTGVEHGLDRGGTADWREDQDRAALEELAEPADDVAVLRVGEVDVGHDDVGCDVDASGVAHGGCLGHDDKIGLI